MSSARAYGFLLSSKCRETADSDRRRHSLSAEMTPRCPAWSLPANLRNEAASVSGFFPHFAHEGTSPRLKSHCPVRSMASSTLVRCSGPFRIPPFPSLLKTRHAMRFASPKRIWSGSITNGRRMLLEGLPNRGGMDPLAPILFPLKNASSTSLMVSTTRSRRLPCHSRGTLT